MKTYLFMWMMDVKLIQYRIFAGGNRVDEAKHAHGWVFNKLPESFISHHKHWYHGWVQ